MLTLTFRRAALTFSLVAACGSEPSTDMPVDGGVSGDGGEVDAAVSVTGIDKVAAGEYVTAYLHEGRMYSVAGTSARRGAGPSNAPLFPPVEVAFPEDVTIVDSAGGLHFTIAADSDGHLWEWGDIDVNPALATSDVPVQLTDDQGAPLSLRSANGRSVRAMAANVQTSIAVSGDGEVWIWDDCRGGLLGDGTEGSVVLHPKRVPIPLATGVTIDTVAIGDAAFALASDGTIWSWGAGSVLENLGSGATDATRPHAITQTSTGEPMPAVVQIASGGSYSYALTADGALYAWGVYAHIAGACPGSGWCPQARPKLVTSVVAPPSGTRITHIAASTGGSYAVLSDGTLWGWGTNGQGLVGNGMAPDYSVTPAPYSWDWSKDALLVTQAVRIAPEVDNFVRVFSGSALVFYAYAQTTDGRLFSWGRNKTGNLGSGVHAQNSAQAATYPNSWDVIVPTEVDPMRATPMPTTSPHCVAHPDAPSCWCGNGPNDPQNC